MEGIVPGAEGICRRRGWNLGCKLKKPGFLKETRPLEWLEPSHYSTSLFKVIKSLEVCP